MEMEDGIEGAVNVFHKHIAKHLPDITRVKTPTSRPRGLFSYLYNKIQKKRSWVLCRENQSSHAPSHSPVFLYRNEGVTYNQPHSKVVFCVAAYSVCNLISGVHHLAFIIDPPKEIFPLGE
jgi:hypothetical protein